MWASREGIKRYLKEYGLFICSTDYQKKRAFLNGEMKSYVIAGNLNGKGYIV